MEHSLHPTFRPRSIAVIGASRRLHSIGREIVDNLISNNFQGVVFPVNTNAEVVHSIKCYRSVQEIPDAVDLAIIVVPKDHVLKVAEECGQKGIKGIVVISAGFREVGGNGVSREDELLDIVRKYDMRMIGPNCMGIINLHGDVSMNATFAPMIPTEGRVGFISQSGALGVIILNHAARLGLGFSIFASMGNKADVSANDLLEYLYDDPGTDVVLMYLESFGNPRNFTRIARKFTSKKPIIAVKAGRTLAGARAASSHTGALAGLDIAVDALFAQCGVLRVSTIEELFDLAMAFTMQPIPKGNRIAVLTNAGGPGIMATDAIVSCGLKMAEFPEEMKAELQKNLSEDSSVHNPIDMIAMGGPDQYRASLKILLSSDKVDAVIVIFVTPKIVDPQDIINVIEEVAQNYDIPVLACIMGKDIDTKRKDVKRRIPLYNFPESAVKSVNAMVQYRLLRDRPAGEIKAFEVDQKAVEEIIRKARSEQRTRLCEMEVEEILRAYRFPLPQSKMVKTAQEAIAFAEDIGFPVVLKVIAKDLIHKSDVGGVYVNVNNSLEIKGAFHEIQSNFREFDAVKVQEMVGKGKEILLGMTLDPSFGPLIMFGLGGIYVEMIKDVTLKIWPITDLSAREMVRSIKGYHLLTGFRGEKSVDMEVIEESIMRLSQLVGDHPAIKEMDINPMIVFSKREEAKVVDARIFLTKE